jgi:dihydroorotase-like cyclic amidohydrolase
MSPLRATSQRSILRVNFLSGVIDYLASCISPKATAT